MNQSPWRQFKIKEGQPSPEFVPRAQAALCGCGRPATHLGRCSFRAKGKHRGNPNWGANAIAGSQLFAEQPTEFEKFIALHAIPEAGWHRSHLLRAWVKENWRRRYVPEGLLAQLGYDASKLPAAFDRDDSMEARQA